MVDSLVTLFICSLFLVTVYMLSPCNSSPKDLNDHPGLFKHIFLHNALVLCIKPGTGILQNDL